MTERNLEKPANAWWIPQPDVSRQARFGGPALVEGKSVSILRGAIAFIMEDLDPRDRVTAWITTDDSSLGCPLCGEEHFWTSRGVWFADSARELHQPR